MPTARELLEQADALMRRNRGRDLDSEIPELTDEVVVASPEARTMEPSPAVPRPPPPQYARQADDVPELNDAVEELSLEPLPDDDGEISRWLEGDLGEASITGPAPDSIVVVPTSTVPSPPSPETPPIAPGSAESGPTAATPPSAEVSDDTPTNVEISESTPPRVEISDDIRASIEISDDTPASVIASLMDEAAPAFAPPSVAAPHEEMPAVEPPTASAALGTRVSRTLSGPPAEPPPASDPGFDAMLGAAAEAALEQETSPAPEPTAATPESPHTEPEPVEASISAAEVPKEHQWEGLAEEIRMQVLQRIDIFTDTGLQGELAARLQPIVDRASADLVTTINREVGQILRAYVAEAIEREIAKWRETNP